MTILLKKNLRLEFHFKGWEVKSLREGQVNLTDTYVMVKDNEAWLLNTNISPLKTASTHYVTEPTRSRKLLLNYRELKRLMMLLNKKGAPVSALLCIGKVT